MCLVTQCCCGCSLETGCKIIAILGLIFGGIGLSFSVIGLAAFAGDAFFILMFMSHLCYIVASAMLLYGALESKATPVLAYLIAEALSIIMAAIQIVLGLIVLASVYVANNATAAFFVACMVISGLVMMLNIYFWIVVYSFFKELKEEGARKSQVMGMSGKA